MRRDIDEVQAKAQRIASQWRASVLSWYPKNGRRELIWRNLSGENASYGVYVSEIMLQQTQVKRVSESFYHPFMSLFPTLPILASSSLESVLKAWEGLGYYSRARMLHKSAQICVEKYSGKLPCDYDLLRELPGIGSYTAGAILCFGFGRAVSFVDGNIARVLCRVFALTTPSQKELEQLAKMLLSQDSSFDYNQALLDIGALICTPKSPSCAICPLQAICEGKESPFTYPMRAKKLRENLDLHIALCVDSSAIAFIKSTQMLYRGLYNLPLLNAEYVESCELLGSFKHHYTKYNITAFVYRVSGAEITQYVANNGADIVFIPLQELESKPLSNLAKKALNIAGIS